MSSAQQPSAYAPAASNSQRRSGKPSNKRAVLGEIQPRVSPSYGRPSHYKFEAPPSSSPRLPHHESLRPEGNLSVRDKAAAEKVPVVGKKHLAVIVDENAHSSKRDSQISTTSTTSAAGKGKRKTHVGPWQLGRTLGKGATGKVRLARHAVNGQVSAVKIVSKKSAALVQSASMARMDTEDTALFILAGPRTIPFSIEREIVIMKLVQHPNVINLYDIWENRGELYLVLEFVSGGELFDYVSSNGALPEGESVRLFRQIIAGLSHCHRFNICHRDLKPENILLDENRNIKLADFGMAALQPHGEYLNTSCGSPHYAAPEIIACQPYHGNKADIWSVGIILYAMLNGYLPFDGGNLQKTLALVKKGDYYLPPTLSCEAADLIQRILQKRPERRISMEQIWAHPLLHKWAKHHVEGNGASPACGPAPALSADEMGTRIAKRSDIDPEVLGNLRTLWHGQKHEDLIKRLLSDEPNQEKLFYWALIKFREEQLENYPGDPLQYSASDYHHVIKHKAPKKMVSTGRGHARRPSQFSIVSDGNKARDSYYKNPGTAVSKHTQSSYDPYRDSRPKMVASSINETTVKVRHRGVTGLASSSTGSPETPPMKRTKTPIPAMPSFTSEDLERLIQKKPTAYSTVTSISSLSSTTRRGPVVRKSISSRRQVSFQHERRTPSSANASVVVQASPLTRERPQTRNSHRPTIATGSPVTPHLLPSAQRPVARKVQSEGDTKKRNYNSFDKDARKASAELKTFCDEAFNRSSISSHSGHYQQPLDSSCTTVSAHDYTVPEHIRNRPLPATPVLQELIERRQKIVETWGDGEPGVLVEMLAALDKRIDAELYKQKSDKRSISAPYHSTAGQRYYHSASATNTMEDLKRHRDEARAASDPVNSDTVRTGNAATIRLVTPDPATPLHVRIEPLRVRKNKAMPINSLRGGPTESPEHRSEGYDKRIYPPRGLDTIEEVPLHYRKSADNAGNRKWSSWLGKRTSATTDANVLGSSRERVAETADGGHVIQAVQTSGSTNSSAVSVGENCESETGEVETAEAKKRRWFQKMFSRDKPKTLPIQTRDLSVVQDIASETESNDTANEPAGFAAMSRAASRRGNPPSSSVDTGAAAAPVNPIEISQNWFAKLFHVKPATRVICFSTSKGRARKELVRILKAWRKYGVQDVMVEKRAGGDVLRGRVDAANYLGLKPVYFHAHLYTVLEKGRKVNLSTARFTQEKGAASTFMKVLDTLEEVLKDRGMLVLNSERRKGIEKSLKEAGL